MDIVVKGFQSINQSFLRRRSSFRFSALTPPLLRAFAVLLSYIR